MKKTHNHKIKSLKIRLYEIEKLLDKMTKRSKRQVKCLIRCWGDWWATIGKEEINMPKKKKKAKTKKKGKKKGKKKRR